MAFSQFTQNLQRIMREKGMTQAELGRRTRIHPQNINKYLKGTRVPSSEIVLRIAHALEVSANGLISGDIEPHLDKNTLYKIFLEAFEGSQRQQIFRHLAPEKIEPLLQLVEQFGGWSALYDFLIEELSLQKLGESEYHRIRQEIYDQLREDDLFSEPSDIKKKTAI